MPKERNKADDYREKAYAGDTKAMNSLGVCYERGTTVRSTDINELSKIVSGFGRMRK